MVRHLHPVIKANWETVSSDNEPLLILWFSLPTFIPPNCFIAFGLKSCHDDVHIIVPISQHALLVWGHHGIGRQPEQSKEMCIKPVIILFPKEVKGTIEGHIRDRRMRMVTSFFPHCSRNTLHICLLYSSQHIHFKSMPLLPTPVLSIRRYGLPEGSSKSLCRTHNYGSKIPLSVEATDCLNNTQWMPASNRNLIQYK